MLHSNALRSVSLELSPGGRSLDDADAIDFEAILRFLRKRYRLCIAWLVAGLLVGAIYAVVSPPSYTATAAVLLQDPSAKGAGDAAGRSDAAHSTYVETQVQVFSSDEVIGRVVDSLKLVDDPEFGRNAGWLRTWLIGKIRLLLRSPSVPQRDPRYAAIVRVRRALLVHRVGMSDVLEIQFRSRNSDRSAAFADAVIRSYVESRIAVQQDARSETAAQIAALLETLRDKAFPLRPATDLNAAAPMEGDRAKARFLEEQQRTEAYRSLYGSLVQRAIGGADALFPSSNLQVITPPAPPLLGSSPVTFIIGFGAFFAVVGFGHALLRETTDNTLRTADDVRRSQKVEHVFAVPKLRSRRRGFARPGRNRAGSGTLLDHAPALNAMGKLAVGLLESNSRPGQRVVGFVAPTSGAGVSTIALQFAHAITQTGQVACLIDAAWRQSPCDIGQQSGQTFGCLVGCANTIPSAAGSLDVLTLRANTPVAELSASLSILAALRTFTDEYQWLIVDFHALAQTMDIEIAITRMDYVIAVAEANRTTRQELRNLLSIIPPLKQTAVVLNKAPIRDGTMSMSDKD